MKETQLNEKIRNAIKQAGYKSNSSCRFRMGDWEVCTAPRNASSFSRGVEASTRMVFE